MNVFLGLGLPWMMGAFYWSNSGATDDWVAKYLELAKKYPNGVFVVKAGDLAFSVMVFLVASIICIGTLLLRRKNYGFELGGPTEPKRLTAWAFVLLWFFYITLSTWKSMAGDVSYALQARVIALGLVILLALGFFSSFLMRSCSGDDGRGSIPFGLMDTE